MLLGSGFGWLTDPLELGGASLSGRTMLAPALLVHADADLQRRVLPRLMRGDVVACQLFSEPDAGSDLASVRTRARRADGIWIVDGHKVWSSMTQPPTSACPRP